MKTFGIFQKPLSGESRRNSVLVSLALLGLLCIIPVAILVRPDSIQEQGALIFEGIVAVAVIALFRRELRRRQVELPWPVAVLFALDIWSNTVANFLDFYTRISYWDHIAHALGTAVTTIGILMVLKILQRRGKLQLGGLFIAVVAFSIALALGVVYELTELAGDIWFHTTRITGRLDTSNDLFFNALGALIALILAHPRSILQKITNDRLPVLHQDSPY